MLTLEEEIMKMQNVIYLALAFIDVDITLPKQLANKILEHVSELKDSEIVTAEEFDAMSEKADNLYAFVKACEVFKQASEIFIQSRDGIYYQPIPKGSFVSSPGTC